jgi:hypothetical protein
VTLQQDDVTRDATLCEVVRDARPDDPAADDDDRTHA